MWGQRVVGGCVRVSMEGYRPTADAVPIPRVFTREAAHAPPLHYTTLRYITVPIYLPTPTTLHHAAGGDEPCAVCPQ